MENWRLRVFKEHNYSHMTGNAQSLSLLATKPAFPPCDVISFLPQTHHHLLPAAWEVMAHALLSSNKHLNFCECLKQFLEPQFFQALKLHLDFKWPVFWKQIPAPTGKEQIRWPMRRRCRVLEPTQAWGRHHCNVYGVSERTACSPSPKVQFKEVGKMGEE